MVLDLSNLSALSRLLDEAWDLAPLPLEEWFAALPEPHRHLIPRLREMLAERAGEGHADFMAQGPKWDEGAVDDAAGNATARSGDLLGAYRLIREIRRGGMSSVWLGERADGTVKRPVAIKMPLLTLTSAAQTERFERERDVLAMLTHPQIARLYDAGVAPMGQPFIVLEYVDGLPITEACNARQLDVRARLRMFLQVLVAVDHAHKHLVVHRDIKPSNVFVNTEGQVKLLDFGIAKLIDAPDQAAGSQLTRDAGCAMTPRYAAPEQIERRPISTATDVYSLGVLLYELLTGGLPHAEAQRSIAEAVHAVLHAEPVRPSQADMDAATPAQRGFPDAARLRSLLAGDLDTIVLKALRKVPAERYGSIERFADDIKRYLGQRPIQARPPSFLYRSQLFLLRHRNACLAAFIGLVGAFVLAGATLQQHLQSADERARSDAVRGFMLELVEDAEPDEQHPDVEPTGRQMIASAVRRAREGFAGQPRLRGELLLTLGYMRGRLGDADESTALVEEALALLQANAPAGDSALNKARARVAKAALDHGEVDRAKALAESALMHCTDGADCAKARLYANTVLANIEIQGGHTGAALERMREGVHDSELGFGPTHKETALVLMNLAMYAQQAGQLDEARQQLDRALALSQNANLPWDDRIQMFETRAYLSLDLGEYVQARDRFLDVLKQTIGKPEQAEELRLLATAQIALGEIDGARESADKALGLDAQLGVPIETTLAHQANARALSLAGLSEEAIAEMQIVIQGLHELGYQPRAVQILRARRIVGEAKVRAGDFDGGLKQLLSVAADQSAVQAGQEVELAQVFDLIGCALRESGRAAEAMTWHEKANRLLETKLSPAHPIRQRNALYRQAATWRANPTPESAAELNRAAAAYAERFPGDSVWRVVIDRALHPTVCRAAQVRACALIL